MIFIADYQRREGSSLPACLLAAGRPIDRAFSLNGFAPSVIRLITISDSVLHLESFRLRDDNSVAEATLFVVGNCKIGNKTCIGVGWK